MPTKHHNECLSCLTPQQRKFVDKHWEKLVSLHPGFESSDWTEEECRWWTSFYQADPSRLGDWKSCQEYLPGKAKERTSDEPLPDEMLMHAEAAGDNSEDEAPSGDSLADAFFDRAVDELRQIVREERSAGHLTRTQETGLKWVLLLLSKPTQGQDLESVLKLGGFNVHALVVQINRRAHKRIISHKTLAQALDVVFQSIRKRTGKSGYIGSYRIKNPARAKVSSTPSHYESLPAPRAMVSPQRKTRLSTAERDGGVR